MKRILTLAALGTLALSASAHPGHGSTGLVEGLLHPLGADHLLAMVAVGLWSARTQTGARCWLAPLTFVSAMAVGAVLGLAGLVLPLTEAGIALSVSLLGLMLLAGRQLPTAAGLSLIAAAALLHGLAHGAELPAGGQVVAYGSGFLLATAALHGAGVGIGTAWREARAGVWRLLGVALGGAGLALLLARA